ncbi:MAG: ATP-binding protein [Rhizomicrobium sp.]
MFEVADTVVREHDLRLVALAVAICVFSSYTAFSLVSRARHSTGSWPMRWNMAAAVVTGCGVWATHFVSMLGFRTDIPIHFNVGMTAFSAAVAIIMAGFGFGISRPGFRGFAGGCVVGAGVAVMHYLGMAAMHMPGHGHLDPILVCASLAGGITLAGLALWLAERLPSPAAMLWGGPFMALAMLTMHYLGIAALRVPADSAAAAGAEIVLHLWLVAAVTSVTLLIAGLGLAGAIVGKYVSEIDAAHKEQEAIAANLRRALDAASAAEHAKSQFLATMSHELRTPLNAIIGFSEMIKDQALGPVGNPSYMAYATDIHRGGIHLLHLLNDILDLTKLDAHLLQLADNLIDLNDKAAVCVRVLHVEAAEARVTVTIHAEPGMPLLVADARRVRQIIVNLLSNAIKFTPQGGLVDIRMRRLRAGVAVAVADTGIGIAPDDLATALARFGQVDSELTRKYEGTGLGLPIAKELAELHGGTLEIESAPGQGTTVTLWLPPERLAALRKVA